jgi:DNA (cytosine-5)-methyltransferase 1
LFKEETMKSIKIIQELQAITQLCESIVPSLIDNGEGRAVASHLIQHPELKPPYITNSEYTKILKAFRTQFDIPKESSLQFKQTDIPFPPPTKAKFKFIDLFAGIGGFRMAMQDLGGHCVFSSEWDKHAKQTYFQNYGEIPFGDITKVNAADIPDHDILCGGFPCQPFSRAGVSARTSINKAHGFACETQGTLFFDIVRIAKEKKPRFLFLENVANLEKHDGGVTFSVIRDTIENELKYRFEYKVINAVSLVPQNRRRCYMICTRDADDCFSFPDFDGPPLPLSTILESHASSEYVISDKLWAGHQRRTKRNLERGAGFTAFLADPNKPSNTLVARYGKDGKECLVPVLGDNPRKLTKRECARLQGFPDQFITSESKAQAYRQFGNSVALPVIKKIAKQVVSILK